MIQKMLLTHIGRLRIIAFIEGVSFIILMGFYILKKIGMGIPLASKICGWAHGVLFVFFTVALLIVTIAHRWNFIKVLVAFIASLIPFGTFVLDIRLRREEEANYPIAN